MGEFRWINKTLIFTRFLILLLQFTVTGQTRLSFTVRAGDEVTLPCGNVINNQDKCSGTSWLSSRSLGKTAEELISHGQISNNVIGKAKSSRLSVTADCSLVIKKVTHDDVGRYSCRQFRSGQQVSDSQVHLSVVTLTERQSDVLVILFCSVLAYERLANEGCEHTVEWLYEGNKSDVEISLHTCSSTLRFIPHPNQKSKYYESLKCNVTDKKNGKTLLCDVGPQSSCEKTGSTSAGRNNTTSAPKQDWLWLYITLAVGSAIILAAIIAAVVIRRKRNKGSKTPMNENYGQSLNPAVTQPDPETSQDMADTEDGVSYASISYTKKSNSKAQNRRSHGSKPKVEHITSHHCPSTKTKTTMVKCDKTKGLDGGDHQKCSHVQRTLHIRLCVKVMMMKVMQ
ncbi:uncharacterized protein LOC125896873 isoform X2 [Epinephelus fuscoguttatus]|uniref:uncharacterized protein LOC125896873 isoform X2 n=1 Tax=Epinephelus fuscoguttatus TaxID=293821 RepID=UPI0020D1A5A6|nr:uncharacterized protein LOC125896873 isoform X2 [Epinephelus fuscoguttatus]